LDEKFVEHTVFFMIYNRYFLALGRLFIIMIEDLLKHKEASQSDKPPLVLSADVPRLRHIAQKDGIPKGHVPSLQRHGL
jgi:hypothetical protein